MAERHDLDPDAMTDSERRAKRRFEAYFAFETTPGDQIVEAGEPRPHARDCKCSGCYIPRV